MPGRCLLVSTTEPHPDIPSKSWENPFKEGTPLWKLYDEVVRQQRDLIFIVDDAKARRGTGKTIASLQLANGMDRTDEGMTKNKATLQPEELRNAYEGEPKGSGLVLDEGEIGASNRDAMTNTNKALREIMSMGRVEEKYVVVNTPTKGFIDKDILKLADVWVSMTRRGRGLVHFFDWEKYSETLLTPKKQWIELEDIPSKSSVRNVYNSLTREKRRQIRGEEGSAYITKSEHKEKLEKRIKKELRNKRNDIIWNIFNHPEIQKTALSQRMIAEAVDLEQATISRILSEYDNGN